MKKLIYMFIATAIILSCLCISASANDIFTYETHETHCTVEIHDDNMSYEKKQAIANRLIGADEYEVAPANIWCDIFGHDYLYTTSTVVTHKARTTAPRCKQQLYDVTYCEDCDYMQQTLVSTSYIYCCS